MCFVYKNVKKYSFVNSKLAFSVGYKTDLTSAFFILSFTIWISFVDYIARSYSIEFTISIVETEVVWCVFKIPFFTKITIKITIVTCDSILNIFFFTK